MNPLTIGLVACAVASLSSWLCYHAGKRDGFKEGHNCGHFNGHRSGYGEGYKCGEANGWHKRHFEQIAKEKEWHAKRLATIARKKTLDLTKQS